MKGAACRWTSDARWRTVLVAPAISVIQAGLSVIEKRTSCKNGVSMRRSVVSRVDLRFSFIGFLPLLRRMLFLHRVSIRTMYEPLALCRLRSRRTQPRAQSSGLGVVATVERLSSCYFVKRHVDLLCDPDSMEQNGKLAGDGHHGSPSRMASATGTQAETLIFARLSLCRVAR